jgi:hypothetical protein
LSSEVRYVVFVRGGDNQFHESVVSGFPYANGIAIDANGQILQIPLPQAGVMYGDTMFFDVDLAAGTATYIPEPAVLASPARDPMLASTKSSVTNSIIAEASQWDTVTQQLNSFAQGNIPADQLTSVLKALPTIKVSAVQVADVPNPVYWKVGVSAPEDGAKAKQVKSYVDTGAEMCLIEPAWAKNLVLPRFSSGKVALEGFSAGPAVLANVVRVRVSFSDGFSADAKAAVCPTQARFGTPFVVGQGVYNAYMGAEEE